MCKSNFSAVISLDSTFPMNQFHVFGFKVFRRDRNRFGVGLIIYIYESILCSPLNDHPTFSNLKLIAIEIHQNKRRWLFIGTYKPPSQSDNELTKRLSLIIDCYSPKYENLILIGDFNLSTENQYYMHWYRVTIWVTLLTLSWRRPLSYRNQSTDLLCKSMDWFLYDNGLRHERVN